MFFCRFSVNKWCHSFLVIIAFLITDKICLSQQITGTVVDEIGKPIERASVQIRNAKTGVSTTFSFSDKSGVFAIRTSDSVYNRDYVLEISHLSYNRVQLSLDPGKDSYLIIMKISENLLPEVNVGNRPHIHRQGDTLNYNVTDFASTVDHSIGDVLKRLPGIRVLENGQIFYNGQALTSLFIDGDDLLEGKYGIGTRTIPKAMVQRIQVLTNHQPIKVLQGRLPSNQVSINLELREEARLKVSGEATLGGGTTNQYTGEVNAMLFNKKIKFLNVLKGNNTGNDILLDLDDLVNTSLPREHPKLLRMGTFGSPILSQKRYYFNRSAGLFTNNLFSFANDWQIKTNLDLAMDRNTLDYNNHSITYTTTDSIVYRENQQAMQSPFYGDLKIRVLKNSKEVYLENNFLLRYRSTDATSKIINDKDHFDSRISNSELLFNNVMKYIPLIKNNQFITANWILTGLRLPEQLSILSSFPVLLVIPEVDGGGKFQTLQDFAQNSLTSNAQLDYTKSSDSWLPKSFSIRYLQEWKSLTSDTQDYTEENMEKPWQGNKLTWRKSLLSATTWVGRKYDNGNWSASFPLEYQRIYYKEPNYALNKRRTFVFFNPSLSGYYQLNADNSVEFSSRLSNSISDILSVYPGAVVTNYRSIMARNGQLSQNRILAFDIKYKTGNAVKMLFFNTGFHQQYIQSNTMSEWIIEQNISRINLVNIDNTMIRKGVNAGIDKFIFFFAAKSAINVSWDHTQLNQLVNGELLPYSRNTFSISPDLNFKLWHKIDVNYRGYKTWVNNEARVETTTPNPVIHNESHTFQFTYRFNAFLQFSASGNRQLTRIGSDKPNRYDFIDASFRYRIPKLKLIMNGYIDNIMNVDTFQYVYQSENLYSAQNYRIRGRQAILQVTFQF
jgi:hypothetical protein